MENDKDLITEVVQDQEQVTRFLDEGDTLHVDTITKASDLEQREKEIVTDETRTHTLLDFLKRPVEVARVVVNTTQTRNQQLLTLDFPETYVQQMNYQDKLSGFYSLRGTIRVKIVANPQPFQPSALRIAYVPNAQVMTMKDAQIAQTLTSLTALPSIDFRTPMQTTAEMDLPFVSNFSSIALPGYTGLYGRLRIHIYSPLVVVSGSTSYTLTVFCYMVNPSIEYPTGAMLNSRLTTETQIFARTLLADKRLAKAKAKDLMRYLQNDPAYETFQFQSGAEMAEIKEMANAGTVTKTLLAASGVASVAALFPTLTPFAAPIAVGAAGLAGVAAMFGWSKPANLAITAMSKLQGARFMANSNGQDNSHSLALDAHGVVDASPESSGSTADEMSLTYIQSTPAFVASATWSTTQAQGTSIYRTSVHPGISAIITRTANGAAETLHPTPMGYIANRFAYWRGDIVFTFKIIKTAYHSGRLRFSYVPGQVGSSPIDFSQCYTEILDLKVQDTIQFTVPYISNRPWLKTVLTDSDFAVPLEFAVGTIVVVVQNELVAIANVPTSVDFLVEISGAPSLQFAMPITPKFMPYQNRVTRKLMDEEEQSNAEQKDPSFIGLASDDPEIYTTLGADARNHDMQFDQSHLELQSGTESSLDVLTTKVLTRSELQQGSVPPTIGGAKQTDPTSFAANRLCIGETVLSIRSLLKRFSKMTSTVTQFVGHYISLSPYGQVPPFELTSNSLYPMVDDFTYWSYMYAFARGSIRFKLIPRFKDATITVQISPDIQNSMHQRATTLHNATGSLIVSVPSDADSLGYTDIAVGTGIGTTLVPINLEGVAEFSVPFYSPFHSIALDFNRTMTTQSFDLGLFPPSLVFMQINGTGREEVFLPTYRAVGDDFSFGFLLAPPALGRTAFAKGTAF